MGSLGVLNVQESWLSESSLRKNIDILGYSTFRQDRMTNIKSKGGGMVVYYKKDLTIDFETYKNLNINNENLETITYKISASSGKDLVIILVYKPPDSNYKNLEELFVILNTITPNQNVLLTGDININLLQDSPAKHYLEDLCTASSLRILNYRMPTHFSTRSSSLIDVIAVSADMPSTTGVISLATGKHTGHYPTFLNFSFEPNIIAECHKFKARSLKKKYDKTLFQLELLKCSWRPLFESDDVSLTWQIFITNIRNTLDMLYPLETFENKRAKKSWINGEALEILKMRDKLQKKARRTNRKIDIDISKEYQKEAKKKLKIIRNDFIKKSMYNLKDNQKKFDAGISIIRCLFFFKTTLRIRSNRFWAFLASRYKTILLARLSEIISGFKSNIDGPK